MSATESSGTRPAPVFTQRIRCAVAGDCEGLAALLDALNGHPGIEVLASEDGAEGLAKTRDVEVVLQATAGGPEWTAELTKIREHTEAPVVLVSSSSSAELLDEALEAGIEDVLILPEPVENVAFTIRRAGRVGRRRGAQALERGVVATVFSPKGGTGKTVISTNLATTFAKYMEKRTLLIDLDLQFGDAAILLGVEPEMTLSDLVGAPGELDSEKLQGYVARHSSGLDILAAPLRPENSEIVTDEGLTRVLDVARHAYEVVVIDTAPLFHGAVLTAIDWTDVLLVVCSPDVASLKNVHLSLRTLSLLSYPSERMRLVLNHAHAGGGLKRREVEGALGLQAGVEVPYDKGVRPALNRGVPAVLADSKGAVAVAVRELAQSLLPAPAAKGKRRHRLSAIGKA